MTGDERFLRRAVVASVALHLAAVAVPESWWTSLVTVRNAPPSRAASVEITLWQGSLGEDLPPLEPETAAPVPPDVTPPRPDEVSPAPGTVPSPAVLPDLEGLTGAGPAFPPRPRPGRSGGSASGDGENPYVPPRLLAGALPIDPRESEALQVPGEIPVRLRVGVDGRVKDVVPEIDGLPPAVVAAIGRSAEAMRFTPARRGDRPVEAWFPMTFVYRR